MWFKQCQPHPGIGVCCRTHRKSSSSQVDSWLYRPQPPAIQLSLKDSSCAAVDSNEGPLCVPPRTEEPLLQPWRLCKPAVTAPHYTLVGNFKQTSSKAEWFTLRNSQESVNVLLALYTRRLCFMSHSGLRNKMPSVQPVAVLCV